MKIAICIRRLDSPGGAEQSMQTLKEHLSKEHKVKLLNLINENSDGSRVFKLPLPRQLKILGGYVEGLFRREELEDFEPDLILTQHELSYMTAKYVEENDAEMFYFLHDYDNVYDKRFYGRYVLDSIINYFTSFVCERITEEIIEKSAEVISNSNYVLDMYETFYDIDTELIYPFVNLETYKTEREGNKILHVNPKDSKGIKRTLEVADQLESKEFLILGKTRKETFRKRINKMSNVEQITYVEDMKDVYSKTKIALMPSKWEEPFGRIPIEAGVSGIPTIATNKGGLPESVGLKELLVEDTTDAFVGKIKEVEENYQQYSRKSRKNAEEKSQENQIQKLEEIMAYYKS